MFFKNSVVSLSPFSTGKGIIMFFIEFIDLGGNVVTQTCPTEEVMKQVEQVLVDNGFTVLAVGSY